MSDELRVWLSEELEQRHWSHRELARRTGLSQSSVSKTLSGERSASINFCNKIAHALGESPEKVLRLAGILPTALEDDPTLREAIDLLRNLPPSQYKEALRFLRFLYQASKDE